MSKEKKRGDSVASSRSRSENEKVVIKEQAEDGTRVRKSGRYAQKQFTEMITKMFNIINAQIEVEPNADTLNNILNKKDKKKLN